MSEIERAQAIRDLHDVAATHVLSERVHEMFPGRNGVGGTVEVFEIHRHPQAGIAYAWRQETADASRRYAAVLGVPPISSAVDAVRTAVVAEIKSRPTLYLGLAPRRGPFYATIPRTRNKRKPAKKVAVVSGVSGLS